MIILSILVLFSIGRTAGANTPRFSPAVPPPAGRALLSRSSYLEPYDYPAAVQAEFDTRAHIHPYYPTLGPAEFWTKPSLRQHYSSTLHLRYHSSLFPTPPPFEVWFKEQQLIRAINMLSQTIELETEHRQLDRLALLRREMQLGELSILLRLTQIATTLRYAALAPEWRWFEESMYRQWAAFLQISQNAAKDDEGKGSDVDWRRHLEFLQQTAKCQSPTGGRHIPKRTRTSSFPPHLSYTGHLLLIFKIASPLFRNEFRLARLKQWVTSNRETNRVLTSTERATLAKPFLAWDRQSLRTEVGSRYEMVKRVEQEGVFVGQVEKILRDVATHLPDLSPP
ncbi:hypothetical protein PHBOTO_004300 [Pseudozyma hubeiensis]|nr:hypothetical protein PHBOTO_004300 [Pseudozyma hubeiensis]